MGMTPQNIAASLMAQPELARLGPSKLAQDPGAFKTMLTSQLGVSQGVLNGKGKDPISFLTGIQAKGPEGFLAGLASKERDGFLTGLAANGQNGILPGLAPNGLDSSLTVPAARGQSNVLAGLPSRGPDDALDVKTSPSPREGVTSRITSNEIRGSVDPNSRHPEDLGHLPGAGGKGGLPAGFTKQEEDLLHAAAAAESKFLAAKRQAVAAKDDSRYARTDRMGVLSAAYESRGAIDAIGYDGRGGTSYGLYQIASGVGTMRRFLDYLKDKAPDIASQLASAGPANTGGRHGAMASEWKSIAAANPNRFEALQQDFIRETHYQPALRSITLSTGEDLSKRSQAVREVLWSTAVQHGPNGAADIFTQSLDKLQAKGQANSDKALIEEVYAQRMAQFAGHGRLRVAVSTRLADEKDSALSMLGDRNVG